MIGQVCHGVIFVVFPGFLLFSQVCHMASPCGTKFEGKTKMCGQTTILGITKKVTRQVFFCFVFDTHENPRLPDAHISRLTHETSANDSKATARSSTGK